MLKLKRRKQNHQQKSVMKLTMIQQIVLAKTTHLKPKTVMMSRIKLNWACIVATTIVLIMNSQRLDCVYSRRKLYDLYHSGSKSHQFDQP
jgi:hypothetical protein